MKSSIVSNKGFRRLALASVVTLSVFGASNSFAADGVADTSATVVKPIGITKDANLAFGNFLTGTATGGSVVGVATDGTRSLVSGDAVLTASTVSAAQFTVDGNPDSTYSIAFADDDLTSGTDTMALTPIWDFDKLAGDSPATGTLDGTGAQVIYVGGDLDVAANQPQGSYTGTVTATVDYN